MSQTNPRRRQWHWLPLVLVIALIAVFVANHLYFSTPLLPFEERREMMSTWVSITIYDNNRQRAEAALKDAFSRMRDIEAVASAFDEHAQVYLLNEHGFLEAPAPELVEMVEASKFFYELSAGAFDITVQPLLELWQYKPDVENQFWELAPTEQQEAISRTMNLVGSDRIVIDTGPPTVILLAAGTRITLGGIAKGYIVDQGLGALRAAGVKHALIDAGGDIGMFGGKPDGQSWEIDLRNPQDPEDYLARFVLKDGAVATSGNYERYFDPEGKVGHIMDPRTGYSARASSSATLIAPTCMEADALATAVFVLGPEEGIALVNSLPNVEALIVGYEIPSQLYRSDGIGTFEVSEKGGL